MTILRTLVALALLAPPALAAPAPRMAVFGDSLATGAATHPALTFDALDLWRVFSGETALDAGLPAPRRLWPSPREFLGGADWLFRNMMQGLSRHYLDTEEYSWGYQLAESLKIPPEELVLAGEDGAHAQDLSRQADRLREATGDRLPAKIFAFYTGNDLCGLSPELATHAEDYRDGLREGLEHLTAGAAPDPAGTDIYLPGFLSVLQIIDAPSIMAKKVKAFGQDTTCRDLRKGGFRAKDPAYDPKLPPEAWYFGYFLPPNPSIYCQTLFGEAGVANVTEKEREATVAALANRIRAYRDAQKAVVDELNAREKAPAHVRYHYVGQTAELAFEGDDIAGDCFHLSRAGQAKVAAAILKGL